MCESLNLSIGQTIELHGLEKLFSLHGNWSTIVHVAHFSRTDAGRLTQPIHHIIKQLLKRHARLRSRLRILRAPSTRVFHPDTQQAYVHERTLLDIFDYDEELFSRENVLKSFYALSHNETDHWTTMAEDLANQNPYNEKLTCVFPLFHFTFVFNEKVDRENFHLILRTNHSVSDGHSGYVLLHDYLTLATQDSSTDWKINREPPLKLLQSTRKPYGFFYSALSKLVSFVYACQMKHVARRLPVASIQCDSDTRYPVIQPMRTRFAFASCAADRYQRFRDACHEHRLTLHGPLLACLVLAVQHSFFPLSTDCLESLDIEINYNMRTRVVDGASVDDAIGFYVGVSSLDFSRIPLLTQFWSLANDCWRKTHAKLANGEVLLSMHSFSDIIDDDEHYFQSIGQAAHGMLSELNYSNLGRYPYDTSRYGDVHLDGIHLASSASVYHSSLIVYLTCVKQIELSLAHRLEDRSKAEDFLADYKYLIESCGDFPADVTLHDALRRLGRR